MLGGDLRIPQPRRGPLATAENFEGVTIKNEGIIVTQMPFTFYALP